MRAHPLPAAERRAAFGFTSFAEGLDACRRTVRRGATPAVLRLYDLSESHHSFDQQGRCVLLVLDEGDPALIDAGLGILAEEAGDAERLDDGLVERWLAERNDTAALGRAVRHRLVVDTIEVAARWSALPLIYLDAISALESIDGTLAASAHQSHAYPDGACLYFTFAGQRPALDDPGDPGGQVRAADDYYRRAWDAVVAVTMAHGGALSHHHGVGLNRARHLPRALGPAFDVLAAVKSALDPAGILNPGKLGLPSPFGEPPWP
jgi:alkyldihydroxyacetonephosphate synthase